MHVRTLSLYFTFRFKFSMQSVVHARYKLTQSIDGGHHGVVIKIIWEVKDVLAHNVPLTAQQISQLSIKMQQLKVKLKVLSVIDKNILSKYDVGEIADEIVESEAITAKILNCQQRICEAIKAPSGSSATVVLTPTAVSTTVPIRPKLPYLTLEGLKVELTALTMFWDSFNFTGHENAGMSKVNKFSYSLIKRPASGFTPIMTLLLLCCKRDLVALNRS